MQFLRTNTATRITVGPFLDKADGVTPETGITVTSCKLTLVVDDGGVPTLVLDAAPTASGGANDMVHITGDDAGYYDLELAAANVNYLGRAKLAITDAAVHCPVFMEFMILPAMVYDSLILGTDVLQADVTQLLGTAFATPTVAGIPKIELPTIPNNWITAAGIASNAITAAKIATDAIGAAQVAADAVTEIQSGLSTLNAAGVRTALGLASANLDTQLDALPTNAELATALAAADDAVLAAIAALNNLSQANIRTAVGLGSANLDTQLADLPTNAELATALAAADDAVLAAIAALNNLSQANIRTALGMSSANLDTQLADLPTNAELATALAAADDAVLAAIAALNNLSAAQAETAAAAALNTYDPPTNAEMVARTLPSAEYATAANLLTLDGKVVTIDTIVDAIKVSTDRFETMIQLDGSVYRFTINALEMAPSGGGGGGDQWATDIQAGVEDETYGPGSAGYILYTNLDAQVSDLLGGATPTPSYSDDCADVQTFDAGEKKPVYVSLASTGGTFTISSAKVFLQTAAGAAVGTLTNVNATGFDAGALTTARAWFNLNTAAPNGADSALAVGTYELLFVINGTGSDGIARTHEIPVVIQVV